MLNESRSEMMGLDRREFLARSTQAVAGMAALTAATKLAAEEVPGKENPFGEVSDFFGDPKSLRPKRFQPLKIDHEKARADYEELIKVIPAAERWKSPYPAGAKNAFPRLKSALEKQYVKQEAVLGIKDNEDSEFLDKLADAEDKPIPWPQPDDFAFIQKYLRANQEFQATITRVIQESDFCSEFENQELCYAEQAFGCQIIELRPVLFLLKQLVLEQIREQAWDKAFAQLELAIKFAALLQGTKGALVHGSVSFGMLGVVHDLCVSLARHPQVPTPIVEKLHERLFSLDKLDPDLAMYHRLELQTYFAINLAQIPLTKSMRDQAPALVHVAYVDKPGEDVVIHPKKGDQSKSTFESMIYPVLCFERAVSCLTNHPRPFDKKQTMLAAWNQLKAYQAEFQKHEFPAVTMKWDPPELFKYLDLLSEQAGDQDFSDILRIMHEARSGLPEPKPLSPELHQRLAKEFLAQENPLGMLFVATHFTMYRRQNLYALFPIPREQRLAAKILVGSLLFERHHQRRPASLAELVEHKLLAKEPKSPVTGKPFGYDAARGRFWRTGKDGTPDGKDPDGEDDNADFYPMLGIYPLIGAK